MEIFKPVEGYPNYEVSNFGRVFSKKSDKFLKPLLLKIGYLQVSLYKDNKKKSMYVHRLVAFAFIDNPESKPMIDHIDQNRQNNTVSNLRWATNSENQQNTKRTLPLGNLTGEERQKAAYQHYRDTKKYYCPLCDLAFSSLNDLKRHNKTKGHQKKIQANISNEQ